MATGIPKKRASTAGKKTSTPVPELAYAGKKSRDEILRHAGTTLTKIWSNDARTGNRYYFGENLGVLSALANDETVCGRVRLVYIDPPFATQSIFHSRKLNHAYEDTAHGSDYIESLRERLILLHRLLADDGALYLHLDDKMVFHMKLVLDEVFGAAGYRNCIVRKKCNPKNYTRRQYGNVADFILFYTKSESFVWNRPYEEWTNGRDKEYQYVEANSGRRFMKVPVHAPGVRRGETGEPWRGVMPPPGKHWQFPPRVLDEFDKRGEIYWSSNGNPRRKVYFDDRPGIGVQDIWMDFRDAHNQNICITGYPTEKNPELLRRIIEASSNAGDLVLDCFAGSGTTLAVADQLGRRWIGVDNSLEAFTTTLDRFALGTTPMGDFVSERASTDPKPERHDLLSQLGAVENPQPMRTQPRRPIPAFSILAERSLAKSASVLVEKWWSAHRPHRGRDSNAHSKTAASAVASVLS